MNYKGYTIEIKQRCTVLETNTSFNTLDEAMSFVNWIVASKEGFKS